MKIPSFLARLMEIFGFKDWSFYVDDWMKKFWREKKEMTENEQNPSKSFNFLIAKALCISEKWKFNLFLRKSLKPCDFFSYFSMLDPSRSFAKEIRSKKSKITKIDLKKLNFQLTSYFAWWKNENECFFLLNHRNLAISLDKFLC